MLENRTNGSRDQLIEGSKRGRETNGPTGMIDGGLNTCSGISKIIFKDTNSDVLKTLEPVKTEIPVEGRSFIVVNLKY